MILQAISTGGILDFEAPELEEDRPSTTPPTIHSTWQTYDPSGRLAVLEFLSISPLLHKVGGGVEVCRDGPFTKPQGRVLDLCGILDPVKVWVPQVLANVPVGIRLGGWLLTAHAGQVGRWVGVCDAL